MHSRGARKAARASCYIASEREASVKVNGKDYREYFHLSNALLKAKQVLFGAVESKAVTLVIKVIGGGVESQLQACLTSALKCLIERYPEMAEPLKGDPLIKEALKHDPRHRWRKCIGSRGPNRRKQSNKR